MDEGDERAESEARLEERVLDAALPNVAFDGWSPATYRRAVSDAGVDADEARLAFPRGAVDLALAFHRRGDRLMRERLEDEALDEMPVRARVRRAVRARIEAIEDKEAARRAATLFSLPAYAADGTRAIWGTADAIWEALGDHSQDVNWYTKRATLAGVYGATLLYWLGDDSYEHQDTWGFLDRRIDDVMEIERLKGMVRSNPVLSRAMAPVTWAAGLVKAPPRWPPMDLPGGASEGAE